MFPSRDCVSIRLGFVAAFLALLYSSTAASERKLLSTASHEALQRHHCPTHNDKLSSWLHKEITDPQHLLPKQARDLPSFLEELKEVLDQRPLPDRPIHHLLSDNDLFSPTCAGDWIEAGVYNGATINLAAKVKQLKCGDACPPVYGFDTFTGLPEEWARADSNAFPAGAFSLDGKFPEVESNVQLVKGRFGDSMPLFEAQHRQHMGNNHTVSFLHIDCDLYNGAKDVLQNLNDRIKFGTVIIFDDLVNYNKYKEGEVKALWEWLQQSHAKLAVVGMLGPLENKTYSMDLNPNEPTGEHPWFHQSAAFVVAHPPVAELRSLVDEIDRRDASNRDPILLEASALETQPGMGALGHFREQKRGEPEEDTHGVPGKPSHRVSKGSRDKHRADMADVRNREAIIPLKELKTDPEGDVPQDEPIGELKADGRLAADSKDSLSKVSNVHNVVSNLDALGLTDNL